MSNFPSMLSVFCQLFIWTAQGDLDLFMFLTDFGNKSQCCRTGNYISRVIISPK